MKATFNALVLLLAINFLALAGGVGWLVQSRHLDKDRAREIGKILFPPAEVPATQPTTEPAAEKPTARLDALLARRSGLRSANEQVEYLQHSFDAQVGELDQRQRQLEDLQRLVTAAQEKVKADRAGLDADRQKLTDEQEQVVKQAGDQGFQDSLNLYNSMPPKQVKTIFMAMDEETAVKYLRAMQPRIAAKIMKEFKRVEESERVKQLMDRMRQGGSATNPGVPATNPTKEP